MRHITVELAAIDELIAERSLQSAEFPLGGRLAAFLKDTSNTFDLPPSLTAVYADGGVYILRAGGTAKPKFLVIDVAQSALFSQLTASDSLFVFQKILRFAKKIWQNLGLTYSEKIITGSTKAVLFPFQFMQNPYRVVIEREPLVERLAKRGHKGDYLLAFKAGYDGGTSAEVPEYTTFRKVYEGVPAVLASMRQAAEVATASPPKIDQLQVAHLDQQVPGASPTMYRAFDEWLPFLTEAQRRFVEAPISGCYRIEGPAGTGKTLSLILKAVFALRVAKSEGRDFHAVLITHSDSTKETIRGIIAAIDPDGFANYDRLVSAQSLKVTTLSELCAEQLRQAISESEFIDRDALESKELQLLYISEAADEIVASDLGSNERFMSPDLVKFFRAENGWNISDLIQHEISVIIKGRSSESLDVYKTIEPLKYGIPIHNDADKAFIYTIYRRYQDKLRKSGQFDTDDVVITTIGQLDTPIWRRRRARQGYDLILIDETHLFNINEIHLFHYFTRSEGPYPIVYSVDRSQATGDRGWTTAAIGDEITPDLFDSGHQSSSEKIKTVFRSSPEIINFAFSIVASGATLFSNFDNPLEMAASSFTASEEAIASKPVYIEYASDEDMVSGAFAQAEYAAAEMKSRRSDIVIISLDEKLLRDLEAEAERKNRPVMLLKRRGDLQAVEAARKSGQFVLAHADFVGGLEFMGAILVGIDAGRVPPTAASDTESSKSFLSYVAHNRLYVAVTRAKYQVRVLGDKARGPSPIIEPALNTGALDRAN